MQNLRRIAIPAYLVAGFLALVPLADTALSVFPPRWGEVAWRFGSAGLFSRALMTPLLGFLVAAAAALLLEQRGMLRFLSALNGVLALLIVGVVALFILDALQMRPQVRPEARTAFDVTIVVALAKYGLGLVAMLAFAITCWRASRGERSAARHREAAPAGLVVRAQG